MLIMFSGAHSMWFDIVKIPMHVFVQTDLEELKSMTTLDLNADLSFQRNNLGPLLLSTVMAM